MSQRITWKSRPRSEYPWPMKTRKLTAFPGGYPYDYLLGPFTMNAMCELLYRAKGFAYDDAYGGYSGDPNEIEIFERMYEVDTESVTPYYATGFNGIDNFFSFTLFEIGVTDPWASVDDRGDYYIFDINGDFYLRGSIEIIDGVDAPVGNWSNVAAGGPTTVTFKLASGDFPVTVWGINPQDFYVDEWYPYATKAGDPAWNTSTGAPANGGPGG